MMVSNRNLLFQGAPIFRCKMFVLGGVCLNHHPHHPQPKNDPVTLPTHRGTAWRMDFRGPPKHSSWRFTSATWASEPPTRSTPETKAKAWNPTKMELLMGGGSWEIYGFCFFLGWFLHVYILYIYICVWILFLVCYWKVGGVAASANQVRWSF